VLGGVVREVGGARAGRRKKAEAAAGRGERVKATPDDANSKTAVANLAN
jgi:hypothetical protein